MKYKNLIVLFYAKYEITSFFKPWKFEFTNKSTFTVSKRNIFCSFQWLKTSAVEHQSSKWKKWIYWAESNSWIYFIYICIYIYLNKNWNIFLVRTKFYWSWVAGLVLIVRTGTPSVHLNDVFYLLIGWYVCFTTDGQLCIQLVCVYHGCRRECFSWLDLWYVIYLKSRWEWLLDFSGYSGFLHQ